MTVGRDNRATVVRLRVALLGGFEARLASGVPVSLPTKKGQALLAYLGTRPGHSHSRDKLAALLWGGKSDDQARGGLRHALLDLRRALEGCDPPALRIDRQTLALNPDTVSVDVAAFARKIAENTPPALEEAANLYCGDLLQGFVVDELLFEEWLVTERERLREMAIEGLGRLLSHQMAAGASERAIQTGVRLLALDPLQEAVHRTLMRLYARQGRRGAALKQYQLCVGVLRRELGTEPETETRALYQDLLRRPAGPATPEPRDERPSLAPRVVGPALPDLPAAETPLFGRSAELGQLRALLDKAIGRHGHCATVVGEAGIGKTRLLDSLATEAAALGCRVIIGCCHESDSILPFGPWADACRSAGISGDQEILGTLHPARRAELTRLLPEASAPDLPRSSDSALPLFESVAELLEHVAGRQPLVLILEDLHWADEMSLRLLAFVSRRIPAWTALLVVTARDEELFDAAMARRTIEDLSRASHAMPIALPPLSRADTALLTRALMRVGGDTPAVARELEERIWEMSEGNPFVTVEAMRAVERDGSSAGAGAAPAAMALPARVHDLVERRLDRLSARNQQIAAVAAVIGRRFDFALLRRASGVDEGEVAEAVEELVRHHVLQSVGDQLDFPHERVRAVAYRRLLPPRRRLLHRAVVEALEAGVGDAAGDAAGLPAHHLGAQIEQLADHALRGEVWDRAARYLRQAGASAVARSALQKARTWFEGALSALGALPQNPRVLAEAFEVSLALRPVLAQLGEFRSALKLLRQAEGLAERLGDDRRRGRVCAFLTNAYARLDEPDAAVASGERALEIAARRGDLALRILATTYLGQAHYYRGDYPRVVELTTANLAALPSEWVYEYLGGSQPPSINDRFRLVVSLAHLGQFAEAARVKAEAIRLAEPTRHPYTIAMAYHAAATLHLVKGNWTTAHERIERHIAALRSGNIAGELPGALASSARALAHLGDAGGALSRHREAEQILQEQSGREPLVNGWIWCSLGRGSLLLGRVGEAHRLGRLAVESASGRVDFVPDALQLLGDVAAHPDVFDAKEAEAYYGQALALAETRRMQPLVAHCRLGLGRIRARVGRLEEAAAYLAAATAMYRALDMRGWLAQAEAESRNIA